MTGYNWEATSRFTGWVAVKAKEKRFAQLNNEMVALLSRVPKGSGAQP